jgi:hypothetical protein
MLGPGWRDPPPDLPQCLRSGLDHRRFGLDLASSGPDFGIPQYGKGVDTETPEAGSGSLSFCRFLGGFKSFSFGFRGVFLPSRPYFRVCVSVASFCRQKPPSIDTPACNYWVPEGNLAGLFGVRF